MSAMLHMPRLLVYALSCQLGMLCQFCMQSMGKYMPGQLNVRHSTVPGDSSNVVFCAYGCRMLHMSMAKRPAPWP